MKEVKLGRYAGPFEKIPFENFIQSLIGLVPKAGGQTRLIFHLSYNFSENLQKDGSLNYFTPSEKCSVKYNDLDEAVKSCLKLLKATEVTQLKFAKSDLKSAFRLAPTQKIMFFLACNEGDGSRKR